jgi:hypothetical protein
MKRRRATISPIAFTWVVVLATGSLPGIARAEVESTAKLGVLIGVDSPELVARPLVGGSLDVWWGSDLVKVGLQAAGTVSVLPYGRGDGEPLIGRRAVGSEAEYLHNAVTLMPRVAFLFRARTSQRTSAVGLFGGTFFVSSETGKYGLLPFPTIGMAAEVTRSTDSNIAGRVGVEYILLQDWDKARGLFGPTVGLTWR